MKLFVAVVFSLTVLFSSSVLVEGQSPQWFMLSNGLPGTTRGDDIHFIDQSTGWLARGRDGIYKTVNGGKFWWKVTTGSSNSVTHFRSVSFATSMHGWGGNLGAGSYDGFVTDTNNILYETFDGGTNWQTVSAINNSGMKGFCTFNILDSQHIYGAGRVRGPAYFAKSSDQGTNWTVVDLGTNGLNVMGGIMDVYFRDVNNGFVVGMDTNAYNSCVAPLYHGCIARTTDGGTNWTVVATTTNGCGYFWKMSWPSADIGYASFQQNNSPMHGHIFYKTVDGGATWTPNVIPFSSITNNMNGFYWQGLGFTSTNEGWAGGTTTGISGNYPNTLLHTTDGGATWTPAGFNNTQSINRFRVLDPALIYASGQETYVYRIPVSVTNQPQSQSASFGTNVTFAVGVAGNPPFAYQWKKNGTNIVGATNVTLTLTNVTAGDAATYAVAATNTWDGVASSNAVLTLEGVVTPPSITVQPQSQVANQGSNVTFSVTAAGTLPLSYQWRFNSVNISSATATNYTRTNVQSGDLGSYTIVVTNSAGGITSAVAVLSFAPPSITSQPQGQVVGQGSNATFAVSASGTTPMSYQWRFNSTNISGATQTSYTRTNVQAADVGSYLAVVTNVAGSVTSAVATLAFGFSDNFDSYSSPVTVTNPTTTNGYKILFRAAGGSYDFKAIFGFNYSTVTYPTNIPSAPHSTGGTTKGLYLTVNKDTNAFAAAVNLYPVGQSYSGNFALKFDLWINWRDINTSTEHALFGINHSGNVTNRVGQSPSDGLFFAMEGEDDSAPNSTTLRDFSVFRGGGAGTPILMTNAAQFGPTPLLGPNFDNGDAGFVALFPAKTIPGFGTTPAGTAGLGWIEGEVRQENNLITWMLNNTVIAQYTNSYAYTNGNLLIGYNDHFSSIGDSNNFAIFDNIRVEPILPTAPVVPNGVQILSPRVIGNNFSFDFTTELGDYYAVQRTTDLTTQIWQTYTNVVGDGNINTVILPLLPGTTNATQQYFRVILQ